MARRINGFPLRFGAVVLVMMLSLGVAAGCVDIPEADGSLPSCSSDISDSKPVKQVTVDASAVVGSFRDMNGVNAGPEDSAAAYQDAGVKYVRLHDAGCHSDYQEYSTFYDSASDSFNPDFVPDSPASYDWSAVDADVQSIIDNGQEPFFRLGVSWPRAGIPVEPPRDPGGHGFSRFAELCRRTLMHFNQGWDEGFQHGIQYWEVWNEPDGRFWEGSAPAYYRMYAAVASSLKKQDPDIKVGGPGATPGAAMAHKAEYCQDFLAYCQANQVPLDFYSWHLYSVYNPYVIKSCAEYIRTAMDEAGYQDAESIISEINLSLGRSGDPDLDSAKGAAYVASALLTAQDAPVDMVLWYRGNKFMNLFEDDVSGQPEYTWNGLGYKAIQTMIAAAPERLAASGNETTTEDNGKESLNFMVAAGRSTDQKDVYIVISNYYSNNEAVAVTVNGLARDGGYEITRWMVQEPEQRGAESQEVVYSSGSSLTVQIDDLSAPAVCLLRIHALQP